MRTVTEREAEAVLDYPALVEHLRVSHLRPPLRAADALLLNADGSESFLTRCAWAEGEVLGLKTALSFLANRERGLSPIQSVVLLFSGRTGVPICAIEAIGLTYWKTAADSALGAKLMARPDARTLLVVGAGRLGAEMARAHSAMLPGLERVLLWNRTAAKAEGLAEELGAEIPGIRAVRDLEAAARQADVISCATGAHEPLIRGAWLKPGVHLDLAGSYRPEMSEADPACFAGARVAVDWREATLGQCGELVDAEAAGTFSPDSLLGDLYDIAGRDDLRTSRDGVTIFKNGGGGHLDLMVATFVAGRLGLLECARY